MRKVLYFLVLLVSITVLNGCGSGGGDEDLPVNNPAPPGTTDPGTTDPGTTDPGTTDPNIVPAYMSLSISKTAVKSDNSDSSIVTASVLDENYAVIPEITIKFKTDGGAISASSAVTDESGQAQVTFKSGTIDPSNRIAKVTASVGGTLSKDIPIQVVGSTIVYSPSLSPKQLSIGGTEILTVTARDASGKEIYNTPITLTASGGINAVPLTGFTNVYGQFQTVVSGTTAGTGTLQIKGVGVTDSKTYSVQNIVSTGSFAITSPSSETVEGTIDVGIPVSVNAVSGTSVLFSTTLGGWEQCFGSNTCTINSTGSASATLISSQAGTATVEVFDKNSPATSDSLNVSFSAPRSSASQLSLQASATVMQPTLSSDSKQEVQLRVKVLNPQGQVVGGAPVSFSIKSPVGSEVITPSYVFTNGNGEAFATFTSGSTSSPPEGVKIEAKLDDFPTNISSVNIVIGGQAGSISIGRSTKIDTNSTDTAYILPMSVLVSDSSGAAVGGTAVSLRIWPTEYIADDLTGPYLNEDTDENLILRSCEDRNGDGQLTPAHSAAGNVLPSTQITTDSNGIANFQLYYLKSSALWITVRVRATALVQGSEATSSITFTLPVKEGEEEQIPLPSWEPPSVSGCSP